MPSLLVGGACKEQGCGRRTIFKSLTFIRDSNQQLLVVFVDSQTGLTLKETFPTSPVEELTYFIRAQPEVATKKNFVHVMYYGTLLPDNVASLLKILHDMYAPILFENTAWPDSKLLNTDYYEHVFKQCCHYAGVRNNLFSQLHKLMAHLMDAQHKTAGHTVLYIPDEGTTMKLPTVHRNKEFVQRMEGTSTHYRFLPFHLSSYNSDSHSLD